MTHHAPARRVALAMILSLLGGAATQRPAIAQTPSSCVASGASNAARRDFDRFLESQGGTMMSSDRETLAAMYDDVLRPLRRMEGNCAIPPEAARNAMTSAFGEFYARVGPGGQAIFDGFRPPLHDGEWRAGEPWGAPPRRPF